MRFRGYRLPPVPPEVRVPDGSTVDLAALRRRWPDRHGQLTGHHHRTVERVPQRVGTVGVLDADRGAVTVGQSLPGTGAVPERDRTVLADRGGERDAAVRVGEEPDVAPLHDERAMRCVPDDAGEYAGL